MAIRITKDGRTILTGKHYSELRRIVYERDWGRCVECGWPVSLKQNGNDLDMHLAHVIPRRMGGGSRNDTPENTSTMCASCHRKSHNQ